MKNRFMLAPLTNSQSHEDGIMSEEEFHWLTMRSKGGFGLTMTCAAHVQAIGKGFPGQLGVFSDDHLEGLIRLAKEIKSNNSLAIVQLHHAGMRSPKELIREELVNSQLNEIKENQYKKVPMNFIKAKSNDHLDFMIKELNEVGFSGAIWPTNYIQARTNRYLKIY